MSRVTVPELSLDRHRCQSRRLRLLWCIFPPQRPAPSLFDSSQGLAAGRRASRVCILRLLTSMVLW
jgi:hypothetical protein